MSTHTCRGDAHTLSESVRRVAGEGFIGDVVFPDIRYMSANGAGFQMDIRFWGVRGSIASPMTNAAFAAKIEEAVRLAVRGGLTDESRIPDFVGSLPRHVRQVVGGDTSCVEIRAGDHILILDGGTGIRRLGLELLGASGGEIVEAHILLTHTHWDHISGIPFFVPGFNPNNRLTICAPFPDLEERITKQQAFEYFPVPLSPAFGFVRLKKDEPFRIGDVLVETVRLNHPGDSYGYRITHEGKSLVYATDSEYKDLSADGLRPFTDFFRDADLLIFDAQFTLVENIEKEDWGHSNFFCGIDMAIESDVKKLVFTHHDPAYDDRALWELFRKANEYLNIHETEKRLELCLATEGLRMSI